MDILGNIVDGHWHNKWKKRRYVNFSAIAMSIGSKMYQALLAYYAFTGTDYTSAIIRIISVLF